MTLCGDELIDEDATFFHVESAVAVRVGAMENIGFKEHLTMTFHDVMSMQEYSVDVFSLTAETVF